MRPRIHTWNSTSDLTRAASELSLHGATGKNRDAILGSVYGLGLSGMGQTPALLTSPLEKHNRTHSHPGEGPEAGSSEDSETAELQFSCSLSLPP